MRARTDRSQPSRSSATAVATGRWWLLLFSEDHVAYHRCVKVRRVRDGARRLKLKGNYILCARDNSVREILPLGISCGVPNDCSSLTRVCGLPVFSWTSLVAFAKARRDEPLDDNRRLFLNYSRDTEKKRYLHIFSLKCLHQMPLSLCDVISSIGAENRRRVRGKKTQKRQRRNVKRAARSFSSQQSGQAIPGTILTSLSLSHE